LLLPRIGAAGISVILAPVRPYPESWDYHRILPGPPLSRKTSVTTLLQLDVTLALGVQSEYDAHFELAWVRHSPRPSRPLTNRRPHWTQTAPSTTNMHKSLGLDSAEDLVIYTGGGFFDLESKVLGVVSGRRVVVDLF
ncbi:hypothetical protein FB451DRAFT_1054018, partial [Mycena latifolia]